jgi:hypothetical protein
MYIKRNIEERSCNHCCRGNVMSIIYSERVFVALGIQHAMRMRRIVICGLSGSTIFVHITQTARFFGKKRLLNIKRMFLFSQQLLSETFFILRRTWRDVITNVKYALFLSDSNETCIFSKDCRKIITYQISGNSSSGSRVVPYRRTDGQT